LIEVHYATEPDGGGDDFEIDTPGPAGLDPGVLLSRTGPGIQEQKCHNHEFAATEPGIRS
jgi:hypothetical protein